MGTPAGRWVLATTVLGSGIVMIDSTVVNVALDRIGSELGAGFTGLQWTVNAYALTLAALILLGGSLGDHLGRRRVFLIGVIWFAAASALCGLAPDVGTLIAARALQGVGGALLTPGSLALISASFHGTDRAAAIGAWSGLGGIAGAIGPFLGGWLVEWSWRAVFLINVPLAALIVVVALRHVPESRDTEAASGLDVSGTVLATLGLGATTYGLTGLGERGPAADLVAALVLGVLALVAFVLVERRSPHPLVPPVLFTDRVFTAINLATLLIYGALGVVFFLLVLELQTVAGFSPLAAGTTMLPVTVIMLLLSARSGALAGRIGPRLQLVVGPLVSAAGLLLFLRIDRDTTWLGDVLPAVVVFGLGLAATVAPLTATVLDAAPDRYAGSASGVNNAVARAAGLLAVAVIPGLAGITGTDYADAAAFDAGFRMAVVICAALLGLASLVALVTVPGRRREPAPTERIRIEECLHCGVNGPQTLPRNAGRSAA
ncbi:DHA2 family efflux MFS transporter permease subunit [Pseudonocardia sp. CA-107938]|uniref:DHA2 family efflux MFS transporter permease subunit n=1 Tax=Pseudonocardia sp. CA-107938 TaxID=3240021 RepID=UPI003D8B7048